MSIRSLKSKDALLLISILILVLLGILHTFNQHGNEFIAHAPSPPALTGPSEVLPIDLMSAEVYYCHDGDTCRVHLATSLWFNVRLAGIDAPEVAKRKKGGGQPFGVEARDFLSTKLMGKTFQIRQTDLDHFNRPIVEIFVDGILINLVMVEEGLAEAYKGKTKRIDKSQYLRAEIAAKARKAGIWSQKHYMSPKSYRQSIK